MPRKMKRLTPLIEKPYVWCPLEWVDAWYLTYLNSARLRLGMQRQPWSAVAPSTVEQMLLHDLKKYRERALKKFRLKPNECLVCLSIAPHGDHISKSVEDFRQLRTKLLNNKKFIIEYMVVPEPRPIGTAHGNIVIKCLNTNVMHLIRDFERKLAKERDIYKFWQNSITGEITYTYEQQISDKRAGKIPGPLWYALKTTNTKIHRQGLQRHNIISEITMRARREKDASTIEASAWRTYAGLNISFSQDSKKSPVPPSSTLTYSKHQIPPILSERAMAFLRGIQSLNFRPINAIQPHKRTE